MNTTRRTSCTCCKPVTCAQPVAGFMANDTLCGEPATGFDHRLSGWLPVCDEHASPHLRRLATNEVTP